MPCEMEPNIDTRLIVTLIDTEYRNRFCGRQKRHGVSDSAAGLLACVPTDYDPPCSYLTLPTSRHHHQGNERRCSGRQPSGSPCGAFWPIITISARRELRTIRRLTSESLQTTRKFV